MENNNFFSIYYGNDIGSILYNVYKESDIKTNINTLANLFKDIKNNKYDISKDVKRDIKCMIKYYYRLAAFGDISLVLETIKYSQFPTNITDIKLYNFSLENISDLLEFYNLEFYCNTFPFMVDRCLWGTKASKRHSLYYPSKFAIACINILNSVALYCMRYDHEDNEPLLLWKFVILIKFFEKVWYTGASYKLSTIFIYNINTVIKYFINRPNIDKNMTLIN